MVYALPFSNTKTLLVDFPFGCGDPQAELELPASPMSHSTLSVNLQNNGILLMKLKRAGPLCSAIEARVWHINKKTETN